MARPMRRARLKQTRMAQLTAGLDDAACNAILVLPCILFAFSAPAEGMPCPRPVIFN
jgi:hypothetical protein